MVLQPKQKTSLLELLKSHTGGLLLKWPSDPNLQLLSLLIPPHLTRR